MIRKLLDSADNSNQLGPFVISAVISVVVAALDMLTLL